MTHQLIKEFDFDMKRVITLIEQQNDNEACRVFNDEVRSKYDNLFLPSSGNQLEVFAFFYSSLNEYLNSETARTLGVSNREHVLDLYYSEYLKDVESVLGKKN